MTDESPYIEQRNGRAMIVGHRLSVVDIIRTLRASGYSTQATADYFRIDPEIVEACRVYEARHQEEIDAGIEQADIDYQQLRSMVERSRRVEAGGGDDQPAVAWNRRVPPRPVSVEEELGIRKRLSSASRSQLTDYPPELLRGLLDDARALRDLFDWEHELREILQAVNALIVEADYRHTGFVFHAEVKGWITRHEGDVLLDWRDDPETLRRLTAWGGDA